MILQAEDCNWTNNNCKRMAGITLEFKGSGVDEKAYVVQIEIGKEVEVDLLLGDPTKTWMEYNLKDMMKSDLKLMVDIKGAYI
jgi:GDPmannose 4,6-dehydratase